jgi:hypothetical protein
MNCEKCDKNPCVCKKEDPVLKSFVDSMSFFPSFPIANISSFSKSGNEPKCGKDEEDWKWYAMPFRL